jgi:hypothetical protein
MFRDYIYSYPVIKGERAMKQPLKILSIFCAVTGMVLLPGSAGAQTFKAPQVFISWNGETSQSVRLSIIDSSDCEIGYRIYRGQNFSSSFSRIFDTISVTPSAINGVILWTDNTVAYNTWYRYRVEAYRNEDSLSSVPCTTFTDHYVAPSRIIRFQKLSDFPVSVDSTCWSALDQPSGYPAYQMILKETTNPANVVTRLDVANPTSPRRFLMSLTAAQSFPLWTMIPVFINYGVSNSYTGTHVVYLSRYNWLLIAKDSTVGMYQIAGNNLINLASLTIHDTGNNIDNLMLFNDSLLGIKSGTVNNTTGSFSTGNFDESVGFEFNIVSLVPPRFLSLVANLNQRIFQYSYHSSLIQYLSWRPYFHGAINRAIFISYDIFGYDNWPPHYHLGNSVYDYSCTVYNTSARPIRLTNSSLPYANAYNLNQYLSATESLCTNGFPLEFSMNLFRPDSMYSLPTELFVATVGNPHPYSTAATDNAIYRDTVHKQHQLRNIILDTLARRVYLIFNNNMTILGYQPQIVGVAGDWEKGLPSNGVSIFPNTFSSGVTIVLPSHTVASPADLYFYDLSGRVIDRMRGVTSNAVLWRPKTRSMNCCILMVKIGAEKYTKRVMVR